MEGALAVQQSREALSSVIARARRGDRQAFDELIGLCEEQVFKTALYLTRNMEDAQDVAQEVYIKIFRSMSGLEDERKLQAWVCRITVNTACDHLRRRRYFRPLEGIFRAARTPDPVHRFQLRNRLAAALARLSFNERACFILRELHEMKTDDVAQALGCRAVTVRGHLHSARKKMQQHLESFRGKS